MKILAINGSHRKGKNTARMLEITLEAAESQGVETELLEITDLNIKPCISCNKCLFKPECNIQDDDMTEIYEKLKRADGILIGSPVYFFNVTGRLKDFMDRSRPLHMTANYLEGKVGGALVHAGLRNGGQELALQIIHNFLLGHGLLLTGNRQGRTPLISTGVMATMSKEYDGKRLSFHKSVEEDKIAAASCRHLGHNMALLTKKMGCCSCYTGD
ncbi:flavodoxin family protein [Thermodesulfovibrionales bacterium]|nr:flavodoxin family protein [Thermodesulfovibrionales bacterium]MCL0075083.1 flavodoxin family protein [Thermodesulfovibrionales bacterium]